MNNIPPAVQFLKAHWEALVAADFFTVEVMTLGGVVRHHVLFFIDLSTRRVEIAGVTRQPTGEWMKPLSNNYQRRLLAPGMARTYSTLLPAAESPSR